MVKFVDIKSLYALLVSALILVSCVATPSSIGTNVRPVILDHPTVIAVRDFDQFTTPEKFLAAVDNAETFGHCLPIGSKRSTATILCFITEAGGVYAILDHTQEEQTTTLYEIGPVVRKSRFIYFLPMLGTDVDLE